MFRDRSLTLPKKGAGAYCANCGKWYKQSEIVFGHPAASVFAEMDHYCHDCAKELHVADYQAIEPANRTGTNCSPQKRGG